MTCLSSLLVNDISVEKMNHVCSGTPVRSLTLHLETLCATVCDPTPTGGMILLVKMEERGCVCGLTEPNCGL